MNAEQERIREEAMIDWLNSWEGQAITYFKVQLSEEGYKHCVQDGFRAGWDAAMGLINQIATAETDEELKRLRNKVQGTKS